MRLCDWNPDENKPAMPHRSGVFSSGRYSGAWQPDVNGCPNPAALVVGSRGEWYLCESCAGLPRFGRFKVKVPIREFFERRKHSAGKRVMQEYTYFDERRRRKRDGRPDWKICMWCGEPVTGRRQNWCSDACVDEWRIRREPAFARKRVAERDRGVCAICGLDTDEMYQALMEMGLRRTDRKAWEAFFTRVLGAGPGGRNEILVGDTPPYRRIGGYWDMDHIVPVVKGGGGCGLDNLRTLCIHCHRNETAGLAAGRAAGRRPQRELPLEESG
jgi:5-methylcytosine-specific restriction endonuclease McrA